MPNRKIGDVSALNDSLDEISYAPNYMILVSPVINLDKYAHAGSRKNLLGANPSKELVDSYSLERQVNPATPPAFLVHATNDKAVPVQNSLLVYQALVEKGVSASLPVFPQGGHAMALCNNPGSAEQWTALCEEWLIEMNFIPKFLQPK